VGGNNETGEQLFDDPVADQPKKERSAEGSRVAAEKDRPKTGHMQKEAWG